MEEIKIVKNDNDADMLLEQIREARSEIQRYKIIAETKIKETEYLLEKRTNGINYIIETNKSMLMAYFLQVKKKESKTQLSYGLLNGTLVMKKATQKIKHDAEKLENYLLNNPNEFVKEVISTKVDWAGFKKGLVIDNGMIINTHTGQILDAVCGLSLEETKESFEVK